MTTAEDELQRMRASAVTKYAYDGAQVIAEYDGSFAQKYIYGLYVSTRCPSIGRFTTSDLSTVWNHELPTITEGSCGLPRILLD